MFKGTTKKVNWDEEILKRAIREVIEDGVSFHRAAMERVIIYYTLQKECCLTLFVPRSLRRKSEFDEEYEQSMANFPIRIFNRFYGLDPENFWKKVHLILKLLVSTKVTQWCSLDCVGPEVDHFAGTLGLVVGDLRCLCEGELWIHTCHWIF